MADQNEGSNIEVVKINDGDDVDEVVYACNYCDKLFFSRRTLGGHQNAHRKERAAARERAEQQTYYDTYVPYPYKSASQVEQHLIAHTPYYGNTYDLYTQWQSRAMCAQTNHCPTCYQPYHFSSNRYFCSNGAVQARIDPNSRVFGNYLYDVPVNQTSGQPNYVSRGYYDQGSSSAEKKDIGEIGKEKDGEELDLTLHL